MKELQKGGFIPDWREAPPAEESYRSIFKWGSPEGFKHPNDRLYDMMKQTFGMQDSDFQKRILEGDERVRCPKKSKLASSHVRALKVIAGDENVKLDDYSRVRFTTGKTVEEAIKLRSGMVERPADAVVHPRNKDDVRKIVQYCNKYKIPVYVYGGGSSVNFGLRAARGGISLVLSTHMNRIVELNETNQTVTVQPGMMGPSFEDMLNNAPEKLSAKRRYTCGHFPQSFEYSSVGGWVVTLGSGQASSYYGDAYDLVVSQEYVTPVGEMKSLEFPATATGPKLNDIMKGSEGAFGVLVEVTMKVFRYMPGNRRKFAYIFPSWEAAVNAAREISQSEFGMPAVMRISDPEETDIALKLYGIEGTIIDTFMKIRGFKPMQRCLMLGSAEGEAGFTKNVKKGCKKICRKYGGLYLSGYPLSKWEHGRYTDPYLREDLMDYGILIDTLESGVSWDSLHALHEGVRQFVKSRPDTICMTHASHFYPQGTNLYFIYIMKAKDLDEYIHFQDGVIEAIVRNGGSLSHHHGVGRMLAPWVAAHLGPIQFGALKALKKYFDPRGIMNPGGQLGLDLNTGDWRKIR